MTVSLIPPSDIFLFHPILYPYSLRGKWGDSSNRLDSDTVYEFPRLNVAVKDQGKKSLRRYAQ